MIFQKFGRRFLAYRLTISDYSKVSKKFPEIWASISRLSPHNFRLLFYEPISLKFVNLHLSSVVSNFPNRDLLALESIRLKSFVCVIRSPFRSCRCLSFIFRRCAWGLAFGILLMSLVRSWWRLTACRRSSVDFRGDRKILRHHTVIHTGCWFLVAPRDSHGSEGPW